MITYRTVTIRYRNNMIIISYVVWTHRPHKMRKSVTKNNSGINIHYLFHYLFIGDNPLSSTINTFQYYNQIKQQLTLWQMARWTLQSKQDETECVSPYTETKTLFPCLIIHLTQMCLKMLWEKLMIKHNCLKCSIIIRKRRVFRKQMSIYIFKDWILS